jgi:curved DNA-binding protein CbpA
MDPYEVLGVSASASEEQVKKAYRDKAVKYSTDEYARSPLKDVADQKMRELDSAYDQIMTQRRIGAATGASDTGAFDAADYEIEYDQDEDGVYLDIRQHLRRGDIESAQRKLLTVDAAQRGAEWHYLMGSVSHRKGWLDEAMRYYATAHSMDPNNYEYAKAMNQMNRARRTGQNTYQPNSTSPSGDLCGGGCSELLSCLCCMSLCNGCCR